MKLRLYWHYNSETEIHDSVVDIDGYASQVQIAEQIATANGDRTLAQYMVFTDRIERVRN